MATLKIILQILQAIPTLLKMWRSWEEAKWKRQQDEEAARRKAEIDRGVAEHDQRPIEDSIGSTSGEPSKDREGVRTRPSKERP